jgi:general nucleoside transport system permease protein
MRSFGLPTGSPRRLRGPLVVGVLAVLTTIVVAGLVLALGGYDPWQAAGAMIRGSAGSPSVFLSVTLVRAVPLILTGLAVAVAFRSGIWNIGAEGQLYAGAIAGVWVGLHAEGWPALLVVPAVVAASAVGGALWALVPALMRVRLGVGEVITTILMNFVGLHLASYVVRGPLQEARGVFPQTDSIVEVARLGVMVPGTRLHWGFGLAVVLAVGAFLFFGRTRAGFRMRAVGASPGAARVAGRIDTDRVWTGAFLTSGAIAGVAGGVEVAGVTFALYEGLSPGWGYTAIAVALLAGLSPIGVLATGALFGALEGGAGAMQREAGVPSAWVGVVQALVILSVIALDQLRRRGMGGVWVGSGGADVDGLGEASVGGASVGSGRG